MLGDADLARLCLEAYLPGATVEIGADLAARITTTFDEVVVAFRGTANFQGWLRDLNAFPKSHPELGYCHHGFLDGGCALWGKLFVPEGLPVVLTGHSLGGALAAIVGGLRIAGGDRIDALVTFGAPRPGYDALASLYRARGVPVRQYVRGRDPVTDVPLRTLAFRYSHVAAELIALGRRDLDPFDDHSVRGYCDDARALSELAAQPGGER